MKKLLLVCLFSVFTINANAGFMVEPYLGYKLGLSAETTSGTTVSTFKQSSVMYGGRAGFSNMGFSLGVDYSLASFTTDVENKTPITTTTSTYDTTQNQLGVFVGFQLPILAKVWGTYFLSANQSISNLSGAPGVSYDLTGSGYGLGVGLTMFPFISINAEFRSLTYDTIENAKGGATNGALSPEFKASELFVSVSVPFSF